MTQQVTKVFGPPGTGKTTWLLDVMERELAAGVPPERVAYLTFTVAARQEAKDRARARFGFSGERLRWYRTLHSVAYDLLGVARGALITETEGLPEFAAHAGYEISAARYTEDGLPVFGSEVGDRLLAFDHFRRHRELALTKAYQAWDDGISFWEVKRFTDTYARWKRDEGRLDFTDLLERGAVQALPCDVIILDEAQDLSPLQWRVFWRFAANAERIYIAGDDDQAIYEWAGASPVALLQQPGEVVVLPRSYRCPRAVTELAHRVISPVKARQPKAWKARAAAGRVTYVTQLDQQPLPPEGTVRYLVRNHAFARGVVEYLRSEGVPFTHQGRPSVREKTARAILTWEALRRGHVVEAGALEPVYEHLTTEALTLEHRDVTRGDAAQGWTAARLAAAGWPVALLARPWFDAFDRLLRADEFYLRQVIRQGGARALTAPPRVTLSSVHAAKGTEADHVVLLTNMSTAALRGYERQPDTERRVWYVAITRAKDTLTLVEAHNPIF